MDAFLHQTLSPAAQSLFRSGYGILLLLTIAQAVPQARRFFVSERWGGYARSDRRVDLVQNRYLLPVILALWVACAAILIVGRFTVTASLVNLVLCRYFFIAMRWKGVLRGMGAPGFMTYWIAACVFFLEYGAAHDPTGSVRSAAILAFRLDFAVIMLCAGTYKALVVSSTLKQAGFPFGSGTRTMWFAPGKGLVKLVFRHADGSVSLVELLK